MDQSSEQSVDRSMDQDDGRWLTYPELAAVRGIDKPSAIRLATRKKWRRQRDNRRVVRVLVPPEWLSRRYQSMDLPMEQQDRDMDLSSDRTDFAAALAAVEAAHAGEVAALHGQIAGLTDKAERAEAAIADAKSDVRELRSHAAALQVELADRQAALERTQADARAARDDADTLRKADDARKARGLLARLRAAWRGEVVASRCR
jgi:septal ring factor EnvC (AmiA/AmiB activator)